MKPASICERIAAPLLEMHRKTTPVWAVAVSGLFGLGILAYGLSLGNNNIAWIGVLVGITSWYGFLLSGCERLLAAKDAELHAARAGGTRRTELDDSPQRKRENRKRKDRKR